MSDLGHDAMKSAKIDWKASSDVTNELWMSLGGGGQGFKRRFPHISLILSLLRTRVGVSVAV